MEVNVSLRPVHEYPQELFQQNLENQKLVQPVSMKKTLHVDYKKHLKKEQSYISTIH